MSLSPRTFFVTVFLFISSFGMGQNPYFHTIDKTSGLPSNSVYDIFQDCKGFMWFATNKGICRFDGTRFVTFTSEEQTSIAGSSLAEDNQGRIWYCNFDGYLYYVENGKLNVFRQEETIGYFKYGIIKNHLYLIQKNKLLIYNLNDFSIAATHEIQGKNIFFTFPDNQKFYVLADFLYVFSDAKLSEKHEVPENLRKNYTSAIVQKSENGLIILSKHSDKYYFFRNGNFTERNLLSKTQFIQNSSFIDNQVWICTTNGIFKNSIPQGNEKPKNYFSDYNISSVFKDKDQNYWISTINKGLLLVEDFDSEFVSMDSRPIVLDFLKNNLLISTERDALFLFSLDNNSLSEFYKGNSNHSINQLFVDNSIEKIFFTSSSFKIMDFQKNLETQSQMAIKEIRKINSKYYSFSASGSNGIFPNQFTEKNNWDNIYLSRKNPGGLFNDSNFIPYINGKSTTYNPENNTIYYATNVGIFAQTLLGNKELLFNEKRLYISKLNYHNNIVFALSTNGKIYKISDENEISVFELPKNIQQEAIFKIKIIGNSLFIFGEKTLFEYDLDEKKFQKTLFSSNDFDVTDLALYQDKIIFATSKGLLIQNRKTKSKTLVPKIVINQVLVNNQNIENQGLLQLSNEQDNININFSVLAFVPYQKAEVWYRINNREWQILDNENRNLMLNSLSFGNYKIDLKAKIDERFSKTESVLFEIEKPFWLNFGFILLSATLIMLITYFIFRFQIRKERKRNQLALDRINLENNLNQSKLKAIKSQMNPHFFYNALNTIQSYILSNEKKTAVNYLSKFSLLTRTILEMTEKDWITISEEIKTISLYLEIEKARFNDDFDYEIKSDASSEFENLKIPSMLLQPYIENAIKHGLLHKKGKKHLMISFERQEEIILITIDDNGIGRKKSNELNSIKIGKHPSFATDAMQKRIDLLNMNKTRKITLKYVDKMNEAENSLGTKVIIEIPTNL